MPRAIKRGRCLHLNLSFYKLGNFLELPFYSAV